MHIHRIVITSRNLVIINTSIAHWMMLILFMQTFVIDTTSTYIIKRSAYMLYSHNEQKSLRFWTDITSKDQPQNL